MKSFMLIAFLSVVVCASAYTSPSYNPYNNYTLTVGSLLNKKFEKTETFTPGKGAKITMIKGTDLKKNGGILQIKSGGIGQSSVTLEFKNYKHGIHYDVEIYAAKF